MWVAFVVGSCLALLVFARLSGKSKHIPKVQFHLKIKFGGPM